jgi:hypothetical protein
MHAVSGLETALWDIKGKDAGVPLHRLLGGAGCGSLAAYASLPRYGAPDAVTRDSEEALSRGFLGIKLHEIRVPDIRAAARCLGDLWADDDCGEYDVTLGLCRLQTFLREVAADSVQQHSEHPLVVLVAPLPGEIHMLGATLDAEALWQAGHDTRVRFPSTEQALERIVATSWFDAVDLSLSPAFTREHRIDRMSHIIDSVRRASKNPALVVIAGGRAFYDRAASSADVHSDGSSTSAAHLSDDIARARRSHA